MILSTILKNEKIYNLDFLYRYMAELPDSSPLSLINETNITDCFDDYSPKDNTVTVEEKIIKNMIINVESLQLTVKKSLKLINCIVIGRMVITGSRHFTIEEIEIDNSIFVTELVISNLKRGSCKNISLYHTNAAYFSIINTECLEKILVHGCRLFLLSIHGVKSAAFEAENNEIKHFEIENYQFEKVVFDYSQIELKNIFQRLESKFTSFQMNQYKKLKLDINLFVFKAYDTDSFYKEEAQYRTALCTLGFLKEDTGISNDKDAYNSLLYLESFFTQKKPLRKIIIWLTGGFLKPGKFLLASLFILILFALLYMLSGMAFADALYFSGITFTTIGYGDIFPVGVTRFLAVTEGVLGICIMSAFTVALVKKYVD